jgi:GPH family glycoside/pentoside/hexuronide:cation symporter
LGGGILSVLSTYWCVWGTQERYTTPTTSESIPILKQIKIALSNRPFLYVMGIYLCSWLAFQLTITIIPYFVKYRMERGDSYFDVALIVQMVAFIMLFVWSAISKRIGKRMVYFMGMSLWIIAQAGLFFLQPGQVRLMYLLSVMAGVGVATAYLIPWSMLPDVIELDELTTGKRREGTFYAFMTLLQKMSLALAIFVVGLVLEKTGFQPLNPPESARIAIQVAIGPLPTIILLVGLVLAYFYPITPEVHAEILLKLRERRLGLAEESQQGPPQMDVMDEL